MEWRIIPAQLAADQPQRAGTPALTLGATLDQAFAVSIGRNLSWVN
jgi:hypothetical protein